MKPNEFQCSICNEIYEKEWTEEEALQELDENFPGYSKDDCGIVCDDCYKKIIGGEK